MLNYSATACSTEEMGEADWVLLSLKSYSLPSAKKLIEPCMGANTRVLAIMNGYGIEDSLSLSIPRGKIFGGMAFICSNRGEPGFVDHSKYGPLLVGHGEDDEAELAEIDALFHGAKVAASTSASLLCSRYGTAHCPCHAILLLLPHRFPAARWEKLCWNVPFNGIAVAMGGITVVREAH